MLRHNAIKTSAMQNIKAILNMRFALDIIGCAYFMKKICKLGKKDPKLAYAKLDAILYTISKASLIIPKPEEGEVRGRTTSPCYVRKERRTISKILTFYS